jgi:diguanylate cyclase (GGDEF)-like protein
MSELVDHLADLTGYRDRDVMDVTLVTTIREMLRPRSLGIYRSVGEPGDERWLTRARVTEHDAVPIADPAWLPVEKLPRLADHPTRHEAFKRQSVVTVSAPQHVCVFPLSTEREVFGVLEIETDAPLDSKTQRLVSSVLRLYRNFHSLLDYSERDTLTGLLNRKTFDESFLKATAGPVAGFDVGSDARKAADASVGCWLGMIDIDHFKRVNDDFGHLIGDEVLLLLARLIRSSFRSHDQLYRFGGEEFVVLMRCGSDVDAALAFERLRHNTEHYAFPQIGRITVSVGFTRIEPGDSPSGAFERADKAVYYAKGHGRNQVQSHAELVTRGELVEDEKKDSDVELF